MMNTTPLRLSVVSVVSVVAVVGSVALAACGGAADPPAAKAPESPKADTSAPPPEPRTVEEAQEQIANLRASLETGAASKKAEPPSPNKPSPPSPGGGATSREERAHSGDDTTCGSPCRALASMKRAVDALCRMTGDTDTRCVDAKKTLSDSTTRVASCKCEVR